jgi:hypothetical protein
MKFKKICFSTRLSDLYGRDDYQSHIEEGKEYWYYFTREDGIQEGWYKITVTYIRSGCMFYRIVGHPEIEERFCATSCFLASTLIPAELDPTKDMGDKLDDSELTKKMYRFDDERTVIRNWPNEETVEIDDNDHVTINLFSILTKKVD